MENKYFQNGENLLTHKDEIKLYEIINSKSASKNDIQRAREKLAEKNFRLVAKIAHRYAAKTKAEVDDLISEGYRGLMKAIDKYDYSKFKTKFSTFAVSWITQSITYYLYKSSFINIPSSIVDKAKKMKMLMDSGITNDSEIVNILGIDESEMINLKMAIVTKIDVNEPVVNKDGQISTFADIIEDKNAKKADEIVHTEEMYCNLNLAIEELDDLQKEIVKSRWMQGEKSNLADLGVKYGMTGENVRLIEKKAFDILRSKMKDYA